MYNAWADDGLGEGTKDMMLIGFLVTATTVLLAEGFKRLLQDRVRSPWLLPLVVVATFVAINLLAPILLLLWLLFSPTTISL